MSFLLNVDPTASLKPGDAFLFGGQTLLIGMATVFSVLIIIWACLALLKVFLHDIPAKKKAEAAEAPAPAPVPTPMASTPTASNEDDEIVAVIAAAIAAAESENSGLKFRVVSFRRK